MHKNITIKVLIISLLAFVGCSSTKVIETSRKIKPGWVLGVTPEHITVMGSGSNHAQAKQEALVRIKERIASSVAEQISVETNYHYSEYTRNRKYASQSRYDKKIQSIVQRIPFIRGVALNQGKDYYWEKIKKDRKTHIDFYVLFPFSKKQLNKLVRQWEKANEKITEQIEQISAKRGNYQNLEQIDEDLKLLGALKREVIDQRKSQITMLQEKLKSGLETLHIHTINANPGRITYELRMNQKPIQTYRSPEIESNCADIKEIQQDGHRVTILYDFSNCSLDRDNYLNIAYKLLNKTFSKQIKVDVSDYKVGFEIANSIVLRTVERSIWENQRQIEGLIMLESFSSVPFTIERIELNINICVNWFNKHTEREALPAIIIDDLGRSFKGKGLHQLRFNYDENLLSSYGYKVEKDCRSYVSGKVYYSSLKTGEQNIYSFYRKPFELDW